MTLLEWLLFASFTAFLGGALAPLVPVRPASRVSFLLGAVGSAIAAGQSIWVLLSGAEPSAILSIPGTTSASPLLSLYVQEDPLSAFFLLVASVSGCAVLLASIGYSEGYVPARRPLLAGLCCLFVLTMSLVCVAGSVFLFLVAWEGMTMVSYLLVVHDRESEESQRAGLQYFIMSHAATVAVVASFILLAVGTGSSTWSGIAAGSEAMSPGLRDAAFLAALVGFGTKAGMVPFHVWLPDAHPAAPSNVSALMSGVMIKMGILGLVRVAFELLVGGPLWWGYTILGFGGISCIVGVLYAIAQHDLKRLLAYHSIENIGIILLGIGASLVFLEMGATAFSALALAAALLHTWNHALFKPLLFLGAGVAVGETGTRDLDGMGGLIRRMPGVSLGFLVGALAISALPPFNGFVSEWLLFQSLFRGFSTGSVVAETTMAALAGVLALTSGLAAYCFVKAFGIGFLARPRSASAGSAGPGPRTVRGGMGILGGLCLALGVVPVLALDLIRPALSELTGATVSGGASVVSLPSLPAPAGVSLPLVPGALAAVLAVGLFAAWSLARFRRPRPQGPPVPTWDCGIDAPTSRMQYTSQGYAQPIEQIFHRFYAREETTESVPAPRPAWGVLSRLRGFHQEVAEPVLEGIYLPLATWTMWVARKTSRLQSGRIHVYLAYTFLTLIALLVLLRLLGGASS